MGSSARLLLFRILTRGQYRTLMTDGQWTGRSGLSKRCVAARLFEHLNAGPLKKKGSKRRSWAEQGACPHASSPGHEDAPRPAPQPSRLHGPAWTQGHGALLKSALTKKPLRSVKINYFEVFLTSTPPAFPSLPICCSTEPAEAIFNPLYKLWADGHSTPRRAVCVRGARPFGLGVFFFFFPSWCLKSTSYNLETRKHTQKPLHVGLLMQL